MATKRLQMDTPDEDLATVDAEIDIRISQDARRMELKLTTDQGERQITGNLLRGEDPEEIARATISHFQESHRLKVTNALVTIPESAAA